MLAAITGASGGQVAQGCVGAGTGTAALGFKAGIGSASRLVRLADGSTATVGALAAANFSGALTVLGVRIDPREALAAASPGPAETGHGHDQPDGNSCAIAFATGQGRPVTDASLGPVFATTLEAVGEALLNSLFLATTTTGYQGHVRYAVPVDFVLGATGRIM